jgi:hypothetical protein
MTIAQFSLANGWPTGDLSKHRYEVSPADAYHKTWKIWIKEGHLAATVRNNYYVDLVPIIIDGLHRDYPDVRATSYPMRQTVLGKEIRRRLTLHGSLNEFGAFAGYILDAPEENAL